VGALARRDLIGHGEALEESTESERYSVTEVIVLGVVSVVLWAVVFYAYWYSIKKTYGMRHEREQAEKDSKEHSP